MSTSNFNLRNIPDNVMGLLKKKSAKQKISTNSLILQIIEQSLGVIQQPTKKTVFHDLDHLAGTWNKQDEQEFNENIKLFGDIDEDLWL